MEKVTAYFRYADDMVFLSPCKKFLHNLLSNIKKYLGENLNLTLKKNWRIAPVSTGIDFLGYVFFENYTLARKGVKQNFARMLKYNPNSASIASYLGWLKHCDSINLINKLLYGRKYYAA